MLSQGEINFYGFNPKNIMQGENRGHVSVSLCFDENHNLFVVTRKTKRTCWQDRYKDLQKAKNRYYDFLSLTNKQLENKVRLGG